MNDASTRYQVILTDGAIEPSGALNVLRCFHRTHNRTTAIRRAACEEIENRSGRAWVAIVDRDGREIDDSPRRRKRALAHAWRRLRRHLDTRGVWG